MGIFKMSLNCNVITFKALKAFVLQTICKGADLLF